MSFQKAIDRRLTNESKKEQKLSARKESDINKIKMKGKKVRMFEGKTPNKKVRVANNSFIPPRMRAVRSDKTIFRQESDQAIGPKPFKQNKPREDVFKSKGFVRVGNNLVRGEESVLDQGERIIYSRTLKRDVSQELNKFKKNDHVNVAKVLKLGHIAEKQAGIEAEKKFMSKFTGVVKTLLEVPKIKQKVDQDGNILKSDQLVEGIDDKVNDFAKDFGIKLSLIPGVREQARRQLKK